MKRVILRYTIKKEVVMAYSVFAVANAFIELSNKEQRSDLTNMKLQKLVYIAQGFALAVRQEGLFNENVHAFQWGPVIPTLYNAIKDYGKHPITEKIPLRLGDKSIDLEDGSFESSVIKTVWRKYGKFTAAQLSTITHQPGTPWDSVWKDTEYGIIPIELIRYHYRDLINTA